MTATFTCYSCSHWWQLTAGHTGDIWWYWWQLPSLVTAGLTDDSWQQVTLMTATFTDNGSCHWWQQLLLLNFTQLMSATSTAASHFNWCQILQRLPTISTDIGWFPWIPLPLLPAHISYFHCCLSLTAVSYFHTCQLFPLGYFLTLLSVITRAQLCPDTGQLLPAWQSDGDCRLSSLYSGDTQQLGRQLYSTVLRSLVLYGTPSILL